MIQREQFEPPRERGIVEQIRDRVTAALFPRQLETMRQMVKLTGEAHRSGQYLLTRESLMQRFGELDSRLVDLIIRQQGYQLIGTTGDLLHLTENDRRNTVANSRYYWFYDLNVDRVIQMWTDFGFGQRVIIKTVDPNLQPVIDEFFSARRNRILLSPRNFHKLSDTLLRDGELFLTVYADTVDGKSRLRTIPTDQIDDIIYKDNDPEMPLFYPRPTTDGLVYYPDWCAESDDLNAVEIPPGARRADRGSETAEAIVESPGTDVRVLHAALWTYNGRGWPKFARIFDWAVAYKDFLRDRATLAKAVAATVDEIIHKSGSRGTDALKARLESSLATTSSGMERNPPPATASTLIHNDALEYKRRPLTTGAGDAQTDGMTLLGQVSTGSGVPLHWLGRPDAMQNRAVAKETERPWIEQMQRYQLFWTSVLTDLVEIVARFSEEYGPTTNGTKFTSYECSVTLESPLSLIVEEVTPLIDSISKAMTDGNIDYERGQAMLDALAVLGLNVVGIRDMELVFAQIPIDDDDTPDDDTGDDDMTASADWSSSPTWGE